MALFRIDNRCNRQGTNPGFWLVVAGLLVAAITCAAEEYMTESPAGGETAEAQNERPTLGRQSLLQHRSYGNHPAQRLKPPMEQQGEELETEPIWDSPGPAAAPTPARARSKNRMPGVRTKSYGGLAPAYGASPKPSLSAQPDASAAAPGREWVTEPLSGGDGDALETAQVQDYRALVDRNRVHLDESFNLTLEVTGKNLEQLGSWSAPSLPGFDIINVHTSGGNTLHNGSLLQVKRKQYVLLPLKTGMHVIPSFGLQHGGKHYATRANAVEVEGPRTGFAYQRQFGRGGRQQPRIVPAAPDVVKSQEPATKFEAVLDRSRAYVNQQVTLSVRLRYQGTDDLKVTYSPPLLTGFVSEELPQTQTEDFVSSTRQRLIERVYRTALFPIHAGTVTVGSARVGISALNATREWYTEGLTLEVADLPPDPAGGATAEPNALVGRYRLTATVKSGSMETEAPLRLELRLVGAGRVAAAPDPQFPESKEYFLQLAAKTDAVTRQEHSIQGTRLFDYFLVPRRPGRLQLPPVGLRYFDPESERWCTAAASLPELRILPRPQTAAVLSRPFEPSQERLPLRSNHGGSTDLLRHGRPLLVQPAFWLLQGAGLVALLLAWGWKRFQPAQSDCKATRARRAYRTAKAALHSARQHLHRKEIGDFYAVISRATAEYLSAKFDLPAAYITADRLADYFADYQVPGIFLTHFRIVLTACEYVRYAAMELPEHDMPSLYRDVDTTLYHFERFWKKQRARTPTKPAAPLILLAFLSAACCLLPGGRAAAGEAEIHFLRGNEFAQNSAYAKALTEYEKVISLGSNDSEVYYNLGNTYLLLGQTGKAVLAYERGLLANPRDPDLHYNLKQAQKTTAAPPWSMAIPWGSAWPVYAFFTTDELAWGAGAAFYTALVLLGAAWFTARHARRLQRAAVLTLILWLLSLAWSAARFFEPGWLKRAVIIAPAADLRVRPYAGADKLLALAGGTYVLLGDEEDEWVEIKLSGRRQGWLLRSAVAKIE